MRQDPKNSIVRLWSSLAISMALSACSYEDLRTVTELLAPDEPADAIDTDAVDTDAVGTTAGGAAQGNEGYPCAGVEGDEEVELSDSDVPLCASPVSRGSLDACVAEGFYFHAAARVCVDACVEPELITELGECCDLDFEGNCCPNDERNEDGSCVFNATIQGTGSRSSPNPCPGNRPYYKCSQIGSCRCSGTP